MSLGKLITNLQTTFITEDEKDNKNHLSQFQSQGEKYLKYNEMRTDEIKPLIDLDKEYNKKLSDYSEQRQI